MILLQKGRRRLEDFGDDGKDKATGQPINTNTNDETYRAVMLILHHIAMYMYLYNFYNEIQVNIFTICVTSCLAIWVVNYIRNVYFNLYGNWPIQLIHWDPIYPDPNDPEYLVYQTSLVSTEVHGPAIYLNRILALILLLTQLACYVSFRHFEHNTYIQVLVVANRYH